MVVLENSENRMMNSRLNQQQLSKRQWGFRDLERAKLQPKVLILKALLSKVSKWQESVTCTKSVNRKLEIQLKNQKRLIMM